MRYALIKIKERIKPVTRTDTDFPKYIHHKILNMCVLLFKNIPTLTVHSCGQAGDFTTPGNSLPYTMQYGRLCPSV